MYPSFHSVEAEEDFLLLSDSSVHEEFNSNEGSSEALNLTVCLLLSIGGSKGILDYYPIASLK